MPSPAISADDARSELSANDSDFPTALAQAHPPLSRLFVRGQKSVVARIALSPGIAIVGSRQASSQGMADARWFAKELSHEGLTIVSGLAQGIDAAAHEGSIGSKGSTIAVLGHGLNLVYPPQHADLANRIVRSGGALVTEYPDGTPAIPRNFPSRNRIIAALARAVLVIEAAPRSGSLITARHALEMGVDVFALPGSIHMPQSMGTNQLIQSPEQLLEDLGLKRPAKTQRDHQRKTSRPSSGSHFSSAGLPLSDDESLLVLRELSFQPTEPETISRRLGLAEGSVYGSLLILELAGLASRLADGRWLKHRL